MYASVDDLLDDTVATKCSHGGERESIWKVITDTPAYEPAAGILAGCLLAIGGSGTSSTGGDKEEVYMYSSSTNS